MGGVDIVFNLRNICDIHEVQSSGGEPSEEDAVQK